MAAPQYTCILEDCERPAYRDRMCKTHQLRVEKYGSPIRPCADCGDDLPIGTPGQRTRCDQCNACKYPDCPEQSRRWGYCNTHSTRLRENGHVGRPCKACGKEIPVEAGLGKRYCSDVCLAGECSVNDCGEPVVAKKMCRLHYKRVNATGVPYRICRGCRGPLPEGSVNTRRYCSEECRPECKAKGCGDREKTLGYCFRHANRFLYYGHLPDLDYECIHCGTLVVRSYADRQQSVNRSICDECRVIKYRDHSSFRQEVISRGRADCGICSKEIDLALKYPHPESLSIDHIVPLSLGGSNQPHNLQPACLGCNMRKNNRLAPPVEGELTLF